MLLQSHIRLQGPAARQAVPPRFFLGHPVGRRFGLARGELMGLHLGDEIVLEPLGKGSKLRVLLETIERHELVARFLDMETGAVRLQPGKWSDALEFDDKVLKTVHGPRWRLLVIGAGQTRRYLAQMAMALDYHVTVCDPREEYAEEWDVAGATLVRGYPADTVVSMNPDPHLAVVAVTHDPKLDDAALLEVAQGAVSLIKPILT